MAYYTVRNGKLIETPQPPANMQPFTAQTANLLPPLITELHRSLAAWSQVNARPGPITPERVWLSSQGGLAFHIPYARRRFPAQPGRRAPSGLRPSLPGGLGPDLAAWLVLLDKWMETFVVVARARSVWTPAELAGALPFLCPAYLPRELMAQPPDNWLRVAQALSTAVQDGPLQGEPTNRHWDATNKAPKPSP